MNGILLDSMHAEFTPLGLDAQIKSEIMSYEMCSSINKRDNV